MEILTEILNKKICYLQFSTSGKWFKSLPHENWCVIVMGDDDNKKYFDEIIRKSIDNNVADITSVCYYAELIQTMAEDEIQFRDAEKENYYLPKHCIKTHSEKKFESGVWSAIYQNKNEETNINQIVLVDITGKWRSVLIVLLEKFKVGYKPIN